MKGDSSGPEAARRIYRIGTDPPTERNSSSLTSDCRDVDLIRLAGALILTRALETHSPRGYAVRVIVARR